MTIMQQTTVNNLLGTNDRITEVRNIYNDEMDW